MMNQDLVSGSGRPARILVLLLRTVIGLNLVRMALGWSSWFEGTEKEVGVVDKLFDAYRLGGFRADVVWLFLSTGVIFLALFIFLRDIRTNWSARINACLCIAEVVAFFLYVHRMLITGLLYFG